MSTNELKEKDILKSKCLNQLYYSVRVLLGSDSISASFDSTGFNTFLSLLVIVSSSLFPHAVNSKTNSNDDVILNHFNQYHLIIICAALCANRRRKDRRCLFSRICDLMNVKTVLLFTF